MFPDHVFGAEQGDQHDEEEYERTPVEPGGLVGEFADGLDVQEQADDAAGHGQLDAQDRVHSADEASADLAYIYGGKHLVHHFSQIPFFRPSLVHEL